MRRKTDLVAHLAERLREGTGQRMGRVRAVYEEHAPTRPAVISALSCARSPNGAGVAHREVGAELHQRPHRADDVVQDVHRGDDLGAVGVVRKPCLPRRPRPPLEAANSAPGAQSAVRRPVIGATVAAYAREQTGQAATRRGAQRGAAHDHRSDEQLLCALAREFAAPRAVSPSRRHGWRTTPTAAETSAAGEHPELRRRRGGDAGEVRPRPRGGRRRHVRRPGRSSAPI